MPDLDELFGQATRRVEAAPVPSPANTSRQRRRRRVQRAAVFSIAAAIALVFLVGFWALSGHEDDRLLPVEHDHAAAEAGPEGLFAVALPSGTVGSGSSRTCPRAGGYLPRWPATGLRADDRGARTDLHLRGRRRRRDPADRHQWPGAVRLRRHRPGLVSRRDHHRVLRHEHRGRTRPLHDRRHDRGPAPHDRPGPRDGSRLVPRRHEVVYTKGFLDRERTSMWVVDLEVGRGEVSSEVGGSSRSGPPTTARSPSWARTRRAKEPSGWWGPMVRTCAVSWSGAWEPPRLLGRPTARRSRSPRSATRTGSLRVASC